MSDASRASEEAPENCPCCGFMAAVSDRAPSPDASTYYQVGCLNGGCALRTASWSTIPAAIAAWNRRASPSGSGRDETLPVEPSEAAIQAAVEAGYDWDWKNNGGSFKLVAALRAAYAAERLSMASPSVSGGEERSKG